MSCPNDFSTKIVHSPVARALVPAVSRLIATRFVPISKITDKPHYSGKIFIVSSFTNASRAQSRWSLFHLLVAIAAMLSTSHSPCFGDGLKLSLVTTAVLQERLRAGEVSSSERQNLMERLFRDVGCQVTLQRLDKRSSNVVCNLPGETSQTVILGAHFDFADEGQGIVDDWSGASLLVSLYQTLKTERSKHTYQFVAFAGEERGLLGSSRYVKELSAEQKAGAQAFINLECLGLTPPKVWIHRSTPMLIARLAEIATATHVPLQGVNVDRVGDDDTHPFLSKKIPVISIHSVTQETWSILHSSHDKIDAINPSDYYDAYRLVAFYLRYLDEKLP